MTMGKKTPLYDEHLKLNATMVDFHSWDMPMQYGKILDEHMAVREKAGIFDVSHMGDVVISGEDSEDFLNFMFPTDVSEMKDGNAVYTAFLNDDGNIIDDTILYKLSPKKYFIVPNAATTDTVLEWMKKHSNNYDVHIENVSESIACIALQGKMSMDILENMNIKYPGEFKFYELTSSDYAVNRITGNHGMIVSGTGYTGEKGVEFLVPSENAPELWRKLLENLKGIGGLPCGLGSRDTLRMEKGMLLSGTDFSSDRNPKECSISFILTNKGNFLGKDGLEKKNSRDIFRGIKIDGKIIPRAGSIVYSGDRIIGKVTSGTLSPVLGRAIALAFIEKDFSKTGTSVDVSVRDRKIKGEVSRPRMVP